MKHEAAKTKIKPVSQTTKKEKSSQETMVAGSVWMSTGSVVSRLLGALYIIPWMAWMGDQATANAANALFNIGYTPYALFLSIATAGVPSSISKQVSYYNSRGDYLTGQKIYKKGLQVMGMTGIVSAILMYLLAPILADASPAASVVEGTQVIRSLTPALLIIPMMSVTRGYIQGHNTMAPSAISQVLEQIVRVIFMLSAVYVIRIVMGGSMVDAVSMSTFAAFVGALASIVYLGYNVWKKREKLKYEIDHSIHHEEVATNKIFVDIVKTAIPFVLVGAGITLSQLIDQYTYEPVMSRITNWTPKELEEFYGIAAANAHKLIMIVLSLGSAMAVTSVPLISGLVAKGDMKEVGKQFSNSIQLLFLILFPASLGMLVVASPLYTLFYRFSEFGTEITQISAIMTLFLGLYTILGSNLLAASKVRAAIKALLFGLTAKLIIQAPFLILFKTNGMIYSNMVGFGLASYFMLHAMYYTTHYDYKLLAKRVSLIASISAIMMLVTWATKRILWLFIGEASRSGSVLIVAVVALVGVLVYGYLILKTRLAEQLAGNMAKKVRLKLRIK
ncbi:MAG: polysaccharide biosynthesis protein [Pisciglobus halotolerans]|nr:polysaccharide biosynthesis protein [Pisciglobus halotolerans]